jgi:hypothetical protein
LRHHGRQVAGARPASAAQTYVAMASAAAAR